MIYKYNRKGIPNMKKRILLFITLFITLINIYTLSFANEINSTDLAIYSSGAVLMDYQTGKILMQKDMNKKLYPASTTKILTAIIAIENLNLTDSLTASKSAVMAIPSGYSNAGIKAGEVLSVSDLLDMFLIHSANEIGYIFGEQISGSIEKFADLMNQKAIEIGCTNTHFTNPSGIHDINHYSTAYDMALIARYCMNNETFKNIVNKKNCKVSATELYPQERFYKNTNSLLDSSNKRYYYEYATGIKTGFTTQAKNCLIASASKDGLNLIAVMLGAEATENGLSGRYTDAKNLFNYGFENFEKVDMKVSMEPVPFKVLPCDKYILKNNGNTYPFYYQTKVYVTLPKGIKKSQLNKRQAVLQNAVGPLRLKSKYYYKKQMVGWGMQYERNVVSDLLLAS